MRCWIMRAGRAAALTLGLFAVTAAGAAAGPASGPREDVDQSFTTMRPNAPTGIRYSGSYHAAGDRNGNPPYMRRMVFSPPPGLRIDTSVPGRCTATDAELALRGPAACPPSSRLGDGQVEGIFFQPIAHAFIVDRYKHHVYLMNNADEQILLVESEGF